MSDDLLERATEALRTSTLPNDEGAEQLLGRIEASRRMRVSRLPTLRRALSLGLAAAFVGGAAWAGRGGNLLHWLGEAPAPGSEPAAQHPPLRRVPALPGLPRAHARDEAAAPLAEPAVAPKLPASSQQTPISPARSAAARTNHAAAQDATVPRPLNTVAAAVPPEFDASARDAEVSAAYARAHEAHFTRHDFAAAVLAWERYLALAGPGGAMVLEARYNRAIALARTNRKHEAITALQPFADAEYGRYRRDEARALIETLSH